MNRKFYMTQTDIRLSSLLVLNQYEDEDDDIVDDSEIEEDFSDDDFSADDDFDVEEDDEDDQDE